MYVDWSRIRPLDGAMNISYKRLIPLILYAYAGASDA